MINKDEKRWEIKKMINQYLQYIQEAKRPDVIYHASSILSKTLKPHVSPIGHTKIIKAGFPSKSWERKAVYAGTTKDMCYPFGLERHNIMWPGNYTEEEVESMKSACYLSTKVNKDRLVLCYYNFTPKKPVYLYTVATKDFTKINDKPGAIIKQWSCLKEITPLKIEKIMPNQIKHSWIKIGKKDWEIKKAKYKAKGYYK